MRVLFTTPILEHPAAGGPQLRIENSIKALSFVCELDIISGSTLTVGDEGKEAREFYQRYCQEFSILPRLNRPVSSNRYLRKLQRIARRLLRLYQSNLACDASFILNHVDRRNIDVVWFGYGNISYSLIKYIKKLRPGLKVVCDTDSVWSRFILRELPYATGIKRQQILASGKEKEAEERAWVNLCEVTTAVSEVDAEYYRGLAIDDKCVHLFSNVIDPSTYLECHPRLRMFAAHRYIWPGLSGPIARWKMQRDGLSMRCSHLFGRQFRMLTFTLSAKTRIVCLPIFRIPKLP